MSLHSAAVLVLVLCLGQTVNTQQGSLLPPSIRAEPGLFVLQGHSATIVCSSTIEYDTFRLEKENKCIENKENTKPSVKEARFHLGPANKGTAGRYRCIYKIGHEWSERSEPLELQVISQNITEAPPDPGPTVTSDISWVKIDDFYIVIAVSVGFRLCLLLFLFCFHCYRQKKHGLLKSKSQQ
ncbi:leukocyte-associated immunoglobulin-like receptor 1 isoform X1 [Sigmodon hispidus]